MVLIIRNGVEYFLGTGYSLNESPTYETAFVEVDNCHQIVRRCNYEEALVIYSLLPTPRNRYSLTVLKGTYEIIELTSANAFKPMPMRNIVMGVHPPRMFDDPYQFEMVNVKETARLRFLDFEKDREEISKYYESIKLLDLVTIKPKPKPNVIDDNDVTTACKAVLHTDKSLIEERIAEIKANIATLIKSKKNEYVRKEIKSLRNIQETLMKWKVE